MSKYKVLSDLKYKQELTKAGAIIEEEGEQFEQLVADGVLELFDANAPKEPEAPEEPKEQNTFGPTLPEKPKEQTDVSETVQVGNPAPDETTVNDTPPVDGENL